MRNFISAFVIFLLWSIFGIWYYACQVKGLCEEIEVVETPKIDPLVVLQNKLKANSHDSFSIDYLKRIVTNNRDQKVLVMDQDSILRKQIFAYLNDNQTQELVLTGYYSPNEASNIGNARATDLKEQLTAFGLNTDKIVTKADTLSYDYDSEGRFEGGVAMQYLEISADRLAEIEKGVANKTLYSGFASKEFKPDNTLQAYALELKAYLAKYPAKKVLVTGHTDNVGEAEANAWIGMERAKNVMNYLIATGGIPPNNITAESKGETAPVADNATTEGRRLNRRIEINVN